ncbi:MAG: hypothetical protein HEEMFOPI_01639 [Holosporales bacterium]
MSKLGNGKGWGEIEMIRFFLVFFIFIQQIFGVCSNFLDKWDVRWASTILDRYKEVQYLLNPTENFSPEGSYNKSAPWSQLISGEVCPEFDKTLTSIVNLHLLFDGTNESYKIFTLHQTKNKLSFESFKYLHNIFQNSQKNENILNLIEKILIIRDAGKNSIIREQAQRFGIKENDAHYFLREIIETCPELIPTYFNLTDSEKHIVKSIDVFHFGHIAHVEGNFHMLERLKQSSLLLDQEKLFIRFAVDICEISAYLGHIQNCGSLTFDEKTFQIFQDVVGCINYLKTHSSKESLEYYLKKRAKMLVIELNDTNIISIRVSCLMRICDGSMGKIILDSIESLSKQEKYKIYFEFSPLIDRKERNPTYLPAFLINFYSRNMLFMDEYEALYHTIKIGLPLVCDIIRSSREFLKELVSLCFSKAAIQIKEYTPSCKKISFSIELQGDVFLKFIE